MAGATASPFPRTSKAFDFAPFDDTWNNVSVDPTPPEIELLETITFFPKAVINVILSAIDTLFGDVALTDDPLG